MTDDDLKEIERIRAGLVAVWQIWMAWFCWFFGANVLVFWIRTGQELRAWEVLCWLMFNLQGFIAALLLARYCRIAGSRVMRVLGTTRHLGFPVEFAVIGALMNGSALLINAAAWMAKLP